MPKFKVTYQSVVKYNCEAEIEADSEEQAIEKAKRLGEHNRFDVADCENVEFEAEKVKE